MALGIGVRITRGIYTGRGKRLKKSLKEASILYFYLARELSAKLIIIKLVLIFLILRMELKVIGDESLELYQGLP